MASPSPAKDRELAYPRLIELGIALSAEHNHNRLLEKILLGAKEMTNADGGTLYLVGEDGRELRFMIMRNDTMGIALGGTTGAPIPFPPVQLRDPDGTPNYKNVVAAAAVTGETINLADAYNAPGFDFSGTRAFDAEDRLSLAILSDRAAQEPRGRSRRRAAADQRAIAGRADHRVPGGNRAADRGARQPGRGGARQPDADRRAKEPVPRVPQGLRRRHRRQVGLYRRALPSRPRADQHARPGGGCRRQRARSPIFI